MTHSSRAGHTAGFTLIELSLVIALILGLAMLGTYSIDEFQRWQKGRNAGLALQAIYEAQRAYMADHPTADPSTLQETDLIAYLPQGWGADSGISSITQLLTHGKVSGINAEALTVDVLRMPPVLMLSGAVYDPTATRSGGAWDGLWDSGEPPAPAVP